MKSAADPDFPACKRGRRRAVENRGFCWRAPFSQYKIPCKLFFKRIAYCDRLRGQVCETLSHSCLQSQKSGPSRYFNFFFVLCTEE